MMEKHALFKNIVKDEQTKIYIVFDNFIFAVGGTGQVCHMLEPGCCLQDVTEIQHRTAAEEQQEADWQSRYGS